MSKMVSIVVPVFNAEKTLRRCIDSCLAQSYKSVEVICVNDGSRDQSAKILLSYGEAVRTICQSNAGVVSARAKGIAAAQGEWICFVDADDWLESDALSVLTASADDSVDIVLGDHYLNSNDSYARRVPMPSFDVVSGVDYVDRCLKYGHGYIWGKIIRREICRDLGIQDGLCLNEDLLINIRTGLRARSIRYCPVPVYHYFWEGTSSLSKQVSAKSVTSVMAVNRSIKEMLAESPDAIHILDAGYLLYTLRNAAQLYTLDFEVPEMSFALKETRRIAIRHPLLFLQEAIKRKCCVLPFVMQLVGLSLGRWSYCLVLKLRGCIYGV